MLNHVIDTGVAQEVSSPWSLDLVALDGIPGCTGDLLVIAVAGTHQIWGYALSDVSITHRGTIHKVRYYI